MSEKTFWFRVGGFVGFNRTAFYAVMWAVEIARRVRLGQIDGEYASFSLMDVYDPWDRVVVALSIHEENGELIATMKLNGDDRYTVCVRPGDSKNPILEWATIYLAPNKFRGQDFVEFTFRNHMRDQLLARLEPSLSVIMADADSKVQ